MLGFPTANLNLNTKCIQSLVPYENGVYYGWGVIVPDYPNVVLPVVMSVGFNPHFKDEVLTAEVHFIHKFQQDFYGSVVKVAICGKLREQQGYNGLKELIEAIQEDCRTAVALLHGSDTLKSCQFLCSSVGESEGELPVFVQIPVPQCRL